MYVIIEDMALSKSWFLNLVQIMASPQEEPTSSNDLNNGEEAALARLFKTVSAAIDRPNRKIPSDLKSMAERKLMPILQSYVIFVKLVQ